VPEATHLAGVRGPGPGRHGMGDADQVFSLLFGDTCRIRGPHRPGSGPGDTFTYDEGMDTLLGILHVGTAVFIVGPLAILPHTALRALRIRNVDSVRTLATSTMVFAWLSLLTFVFGFGAMGMADPKYQLTFTTPWILTSIILYAVAFLLAVFLLVPRLRAGADAIEAAGADAAAKPASYGAIAGVSGVVTLLLVAIVVLMIWKP